MIEGRIRDELTNSPVHGASVRYEDLKTGFKGDTISATNGDYYIPLLPPGSYRIRVTTDSNLYQPREVYGVEVAVAGYVHVDFSLRNMRDVWEAGQYGSVVFRNNTVVPFFGPDVDPSYTGTFEPERRVPGQLEPSLSDVIDPRAIDTLPLAGRDIYAALVLQPGVAAQNTTSRSLGLSANGQRPSSSSFLLDGVEENDSLLSGPALLVAPEMVEQYRVSTNNFSAEYGRTSGYLANAITRSAMRKWHGIGYGDLNNHVLNANTFAHNLSGTPRNTLHGIEEGFSVGGGAPRTRLLSWTAIDSYGSRSFSDPITYILPTLTFARSLPVGSVAKRLLDQHPPPIWADSSFGDSGPVSLRAPVTLRRLTGLERFDYALSDRQHIMARLAGSILNRPDFNWSPYGEAPYKQASGGGALILGSSWAPGLVSELRASVLFNDRHWMLSLANLPQIAGFGNLVLPGNCCRWGRTCLRRVPACLTRVRKLALRFRQQTTSFF
jgi:Carboxypeptidase regulatory-like domain